jgi:HAD superfamily phosphatase
VYLVINKDLIIFDMDGVLVDVSESYRATIQATVHHFTGYEPARAEIQDWKNRGGWNDDWKLSHAMIAERGPEVAYDTVVDQFQKFFHGDGSNGLMQRERWIARSGMFERLAASHTLAVFTGRLRWEANMTLDRFHPGIFDPVVGCDDVTNPKPHPEGLVRICSDVPHGKCWYVGDTIDDARSAAGAGIPFIGIAEPNNPRYNTLVQLLRAEGAIAVLDDINTLETVVGQAPRLAPGPPAGPLTSPESL